MAAVDEISYDIDTDFVVVGNGQLEGVWYDERSPEFTGSEDDKSVLSEGLGIRGVGLGGWMNRSYPIDPKHPARFVPTGQFAEKRYTRSVMRGGRRMREPVTLTARVWMEVDAAGKVLPSKGLVEEGRSPQGASLTEQLEHMTDHDKAKLREALGFEIPEGAEVAAVAIEEPKPEPPVSPAPEPYVPTEHSDITEEAKEPPYSCECGKDFDTRQKLSSHISASLRAEAKRQKEQEEAATSS